LENEIISLALFKKQDDRDFEGQPFHFNNLKLLERYLGPLEKWPFSMISVLSFFIFLKAFPFQSITGSVEGQFRYIISILLVPFSQKIKIKMNQSQYK